MFNTGGGILVRYYILSMMEDRMTWQLASLACEVSYNSRKSSLCTHLVHRAVVVAYTHIVSFPGKRAWAGQEPENEASTPTVTQNAAGLIVAAI